jgi:tetratricopeptide (TPR) repeat protein
MFMFTTAQSLTPSDDDKSAAAPITVSHVVIQQLDSHAFALRAEKRLHGPYAQNISDLKTAIALEPEFANAYCLLAKIYLATGQADLADAAAAEACDIEPKNASYQLLRAQTRELLGEYDDAVLKVRAVLDREDLTALDRAQGLHRMARLASLGDGEIASKTISFETRSIEVADKLATSKDAKERRAAKQLLVEAHIAVAEEVARQSYNQKVETLSLWVGRASGLAEDYIAKDGGSVELRLMIAQRVLGSLASFRPTLDPAPWVAEAEDAAKTMFAQSDDEMWQQHVKWELGIAYLNALRVEHTRRQTDMALKYGQEAIDNLSVGASGRQAVHSSEQLVGQLYFQMGAVYAVHKLDHAKAVQWYDKSSPLLTSQRPASELYAPRREGEMLVSMGVSYWQLGNQAHALDLTQTGVGLVEAAVENGVLAKTTLAVPYGNLATMYQQMGEETNAAKYSDLAKSVAAPETKQSQRVGRAKSDKSHTR